MSPAGLIWLADFLTVGALAFAINQRLNWSPPGRHTVVGVVALTIAVTAASLIWASARVGPLLSAMPLLATGGGLAWVIGGPMLSQWDAGHRVRLAVTTLSVVGALVVVIASAVL